MTIHAAPPDRPWLRFYDEGVAAALDVPSLTVADFLRGEKVKAFVVLRPGAVATAPQIIDHCRERLAPYKVPSIVVLRDSLPRLITGKVAKRQLREEEASRPAAD